MKCRQIKWHCQWTDAVRNGSDVAKLVINKSNVSFVKNFVIFLLDFVNCFHIYKIVFKFNFEEKSSKHTSNIHCTKYNVLSAIEAGLQIVHFYSPSEKLCDILVSISALPSQLFLLNLAFALIDRRWAATRPALWYREITYVVKFIPIIVPLLNVLYAIILKWILMSQLTPLTGALNVAHISTIGISLLFQWITSLWICVAAFVETRNGVSSTFQLRFIPPRPQKQKGQNEENIEMIQLNAMAHRLILWR